MVLFIAVVMAFGLDSYTFSILALDTMIFFIFALATINAVIKFRRFWRIFAFPRMFQAIALVLFIAVVMAFGLDSYPFSILALDTMIFFIFALATINAVIKFGRF